MIDNETKVITPAGVMTLREALDNPEAFAKGMSEEKTYCLFVAIPPNVLSVMIGRDEPVRIEPYFHGVSGSLLTTASEECHVRLSERFRRKEDYEDDELR